ncbi:MAG: hypothetical protein M1833_003177 [Piccolia ochrophora]|nr:MAG: hypothetical protein M1833_003177 [Piccolia ochrophora]
MFSSPTSAKASVPPSFKTNVNRQKTKRWVEAKSFSYDGDDWGEVDDFDEYGTQEDLQPKPTGLRQKGQVVNAPETSPMRSATNPMVARSGSFDEGDERRAFSAGTGPPPDFAFRDGPPGSFPPDESRQPSDLSSRNNMPQSDPQIAGPIQSEQGHHLRHDRGLPLHVETPVSKARDKTDDVSPVAHATDMVSTAGRPPQRPRDDSAASRSKSMEGKTPEDYHQRRDFSPSAEPLPLHPHPDSAQETPAPEPTHAHHPPRKSSLSTSTPPSLPGVTDASRDRSTSDATETSTGRSRTGSNSSKALPFIRPADIYKRIEEEREKERRSLDSGRPSMDSTSGRPTEVFPELRERQSSESLGRSRSRPSFEAGDDTESQRPRKTTLDPVKERQSEYGLENLMGGSVGGQSRNETFDNSPQRNAPSRTEQADEPPQIAEMDLAGEEPIMLPNLRTFSGFGDDFLSFTQPLSNEPQKPSSSSAIREEPSSEPQQPPSNGSANESLQHQQSVGMRSVVNQAFDRTEDKSVPPTPINSGSHRSQNTLPSRSDSASTSGISPIMSRVPSSGLRFARGSQAEEPDSTIPAIEEESAESIKAAGSRPTSITTPGDVKDTARAHSPGHLPPQPSSETVPHSVQFGHRRNISPPNVNRSPARSPAIEVNKQLHTGQEVELATITPTEHKPQGFPLDSRNADPASTFNATPDIGGDGSGSASYEAQNNVSRGHQQPSVTVSGPEHGRRSASPNAPAGFTTEDFPPNMTSKLRNEVAMSDQYFSDSGENDAKDAERPYAERNASFRPALPGGWVSYATTAEGNTPVASEPENPAPAQMSRYSPPDEVELITSTTKRPPEMHQGFTARSLTPSATLLSSASSPAPTPPPKDTPGAAERIGSDKGYFEPPAPLVQRAPAAGQDHASPSPELYPNTASGLSTEASPQDEESDRLRKEIVKSLSPSPDGAKRQDHPGFGAPEPTSRAAPNSPLPPNEQQTYWTTERSHEPVYRPHPANDGSSLPEDSYTHSRVEGDQYGSHTQPTPGQGTRTIFDAGPGLDSPYAAEQHSHQAFDTGPPDTDFASQAVTEGLTVRNADPDDGDRSPNSTVGPSPAPATASAHELYELYEGPSIMADGSENQEYTGTIPEHFTEKEFVDPLPSQGHGPVELGGDFGSSPTEHAGYIPVEHRGATPPSMPHMSAPATSAPAHIPPQQPKLLAFREILAIKSPADRIRSYNSTRQQFAETDTGLAQWVSSMAQQHPEHMASATTTPARRATGGPGHSSSPSTSHISSAGAHSPTSPRMKMGAGAPQGVSHSASPTASGSTKPKGKGVFGSKGLFAKGKSKLRGSVGGDKADSPLSTSELPDTKSMSDLSLDDSNSHATTPDRLSQEDAQYQPCMPDPDSERREGGLGMATEMQPPEPRWDSGSHKAHEAIEKYSFRDDDSVNSQDITLIPDYEPGWRPSRPQGAQEDADYRHMPGAFPVDEEVAEESFATDSRVSQNSAHDLRQESPSLRRQLTGSDSLNVEYKAHARQEQDGKSDIGDSEYFGKLAYGKMSPEPPEIHPAYRRSQETQEHAKDPRVHQPRTIVSTQEIDSADTSAFPTPVLPPPMLDDLAKAVEPFTETVAQQEDVKKLDEHQGTESYQVRPSSLPKGPDPALLGLESLHSTPERQASPSQEDTTTSKVRDDELVHEHPQGPVSPDLAQSEEGRHSDTAISSDVGSRIHERRQRPRLPWNLGDLSLDELAGTPMRRNRSLSPILETDSIRPSQSSQYSPSLARAKSDRSSIALDWPLTRSHPDPNIEDHPAFRRYSMPESIHAFQIEHPVEVPEVDPGQVTPRATQSPSRSSDYSNGKSKQTNTELVSAETATEHCSQPPQLLSGMEQQVKAEEATNKREVEEPARGRSKDRRTPQHVPSSTTSKKQKRSSLFGALRKSTSMDASQTKTTVDNQPRQLDRTSAVVRDEKPRPRKLRRSSTSIQREMASPSRGKRSSVFGNIFGRESASLEVNRDSPSKSDASHPPGLGERFPFKDRVSEDGATRLQRDGRALPHKPREEASSTRDPRGMACAASPLHVEGSQTPPITNHLLTSNIQHPGGRIGNEREMEHTPSPIPPIYRSVSTETEPPETTPTLSSPSRTQSPSYFPTIQPPLSLPPRATSADLFSHSTTNHSLPPTLPPPAIPPRDPSRNSSPGKSTSTSTSASPARGPAPPRRSHQHSPDSYWSRQQHAHPQPHRSRSVQWAVHYTPQPPGGGPANMRMLPLTPGEDDAAARKAANRRSVPGITDKWAGKELPAPPPPSKSPLYTHPLVEPVVGVGGRGWVRGRGEGPTPPPRD